MKAVVMHETGGPEILRLEEVPTPEPGPDEVLVQVHAVSINRTIDFRVREGTYFRQATLPHILGLDPTGIITETGPGVEGLKPGDRVAVITRVICGHCPPCQSGNSADCENTQHFGLDRWGGYAEYVKVPVGNTMVLPDAVSFGEACVILRHAPAAFNLLDDKAGLQSGETVLVMGAAGGLGSCGVQIAKMMGATVIAGAGSDGRVEAAMSLGADHGINYRDNDLAEEVERITRGRGVDVVFENISDPDLWPKALYAMAMNGRMVTAGAHGGGQVRLDISRLYLRRLQIRGGAGANSSDIERSLEAAAAGKLRGFIDQILPLGGAAEAHALVEGRTALGKVVLDPTLG